VQPKEAPVRPAVDPKPAARDLKPRVPKEPKPALAKRKRRSDPRPERVAPESKPAPEPAEAARETKPVRKPPKGGILDFEDPDDRAFAKEAGIAAKAPEPKVEKKKELPPLSNADVLGVMKRHLAEFKACNRKQKEVDATVNGKMVINFTIANNGRVTQVAISSKTAAFAKTYVAGCIQSIIKRLKFPEFGGAPKEIPFPFTVN
jgi:outer membrane biosynthesis protein TonB